MDDLQRRHDKEVTELIKSQTKRIEESVRFEREKLLILHDSEKCELTTKLDLVTRELEHLKSLNVDNAAKNYFFRWKVVTACLKHYPKPDVRKVFKMLNTDDKGMIIESLEAR